MKSRLAVSLLFILIAATFSSDATASFEKLRSWTTKVCGRSVIGNRLTPRDSALMSAIGSRDTDEFTMIQLDGDRLVLGQNCATANQLCAVGAISPDGKTITFNSAEATKLVTSLAGHTQGVVFKLPGSDDHSTAFDFVTTAAEQIHEVLGLMRIR